MFPLQQLLQGHIFSKQVLLKLLNGQMGFHARQHLFILKRLGDVIHCAHRKTFHFIDGIGQRTHENDGNRFCRLIRFQALAGFESIHAGHDNIQQD